MDCGYPSGGVIAAIKKKAKQRYKAEARRRLRRQSYVRCEKMGNTLAANCSREFWKEVKKVNKSKHCINKPPVIDGVSGDSQVTELWSAKFKELYNHCDPSKRDSLLDQLHSVITREDLVTIIQSTLILLWVLSNA